MLTQWLLHLLCCLLAGEQGSSKQDHGAEIVDARIKYSKAEKDAKDRN
jgi:hypothetical protein